MENNTYLLKLVGLIAGASVIAMVFFGLGYGFHEQRFGSGSSAFVLGSNLEVSGSSTLSGGTTVNGTAQFNGAVTAQGVTVTTLSATSSATVGTNGVAVDLWTTTSTQINVNSLGNGASTSSHAISMTGVGAQDTVIVGMIGSWAAPSSSVVVVGRPAAGSVTLDFHNTSSTAVDLTNATYTIEVISH